MRLSKREQSGTLSLCYARVWKLQNHKGQLFAALFYTRGCFHGTIGFEFLRGVNRK